MQRSLSIPIFLQTSVHIPSIYMKTYPPVLYLYISNFLRTLVQCSSVRTSHKMDKSQYGVEVRNYKIARKVDHFASSKVKIAFITFENDVIKGRRGKSGKTQRKLVCKEDNFNQT
ncbi:uncharacterized protein LOC122570367 isoform X1 [Bombus pyrosoma]|uniref:uncharacterized protein LOC122570367 isoform X1 n=1 Tax=Bombus pyrosoma TaxID=396416 RepID=UPI001CB903F7|nr:uncharacterized protein LOC122570367 isoform X1 [Bombus pyrosoma]